MFKRTAFAFLTAALLTATAFAESYTASGSERFREQLAKAQRGDSISISKSFSDSVGFTVDEGITIDREAYSPGSISLTANAYVNNRGTINSGSVVFGSGHAKIENNGRLFITEIPSGCVVSNHNWLMSQGGITLNGTLILEGGSSLNFSTGSVLGTKNIIEMGVGARFVNKTAKTYSAVLPDGSIVNIWNNCDFTAVKTRAPQIYFEDTGAVGQRRLTITCPDAGASIYYTIDGSTPTPKSFIYERSVYLPENTRVLACARLTNSVISDITDSAAGPQSNSSQQQSQTSPQQLEQPEQPSESVQVKTPAVNISGGSYPCRQILYLSCATPDAKIYYTTDGSQPTESSPVYTGPFDIVSSCTVKAIAVKPGMQNSAPLTERYHLSGYRVAAPDYSNISELSAFWSGCVSNIQNAASGDIVTANAADCPYLDNSVIRALNQKSGVTLVILRSNGKKLTIPAQNAPADCDDSTRVWYSLDSLSATFS